MTAKPPSSSITKYTLANGMTVLVYPHHSIPKVSVQLWYHVGSKDEKTSEKGIAHLIEHMIFKGTEILSESDINDLTHKLSGACNAFTSYDYTGYLFDMPSQNWKETVPVIADCMVNCRFDEQHLSSEMKAVIQELKMGRDNHVSDLIKTMIGQIFPDHPYHYPIIGFKQDLWSVHAEDLRAFYKKHYIPNNATLVVVGDVSAEEVHALANQYFGSIPANPDYKKEQFFHEPTIGGTAVTQYQEVAQPSLILGWQLPGIKDKRDDTIELLNSILGDGKASRLYRDLVDIKGIASSVESFVWNLFDYGMLFIYIQPNDAANMQAIIAHVENEILMLAHDGVTAEEVERALSIAKMDHYTKQENRQDLAYDIGHYFLATGDADYIFSLYTQDTAWYQRDIQDLCKTFIRPALTHKGYLLPVPEEEKAALARLQEESDAQDFAILAARIRTTPVEPASYAHAIQAHAPAPFNYPKATQFASSHGMKVLSHHTDETKKIAIRIDFKAKHYYDPEGKEGLISFMAALLSEGTEQYNATQFAQEIEQYGMHLASYAGGIVITLLRDDFEKGLSLLAQMLKKARFEPKEIEKVRKQITSDIKNYWDDPRQFCGQLVKSKIYHGHPYSKSSMGTLESLASITRDDIVSAYHTYISPDGATMTIVGNLEGYDIKKLIDRHLESWQSQPIAALIFPTLEPIAQAQVVHPINRDQVVLCMAGRSINRLHPDYDKLLLFDQIFGGGVLGSLASRLFQLREATGLFYTINGTLISQANEEPGMVIIKTIVSRDRLEEAEIAIKNTLATVIASITEAELQQAKDALINTIVGNFESVEQTAQAFLFINRYGFSPNYFDNRAQQLESITLQQVQEAAQKILVCDGLITFKIGRVTAQECERL